MKNNVIGPVEFGDWLTMRMLRTSIDWMKTQDSKKFGTAIKKEEEILRSFYDDLLKTKEPDFLSSTALAA